MTSKAIADLLAAAQPENVRGRIVVGAVDRLLTHAQIAALLSGQPVPDDPSLIPIPYRSQEAATAKRYRNDCGPACIGMLLDWKFPTVPQPSTDVLSAETSLAAADIGLTTAELVKLAKNHGLEMVLSNSATPAAIRAELDAGRPCIPLIQYGPLTGRLNQADAGGHFLVVVGYDADGYYVNDPDWYDTSTSTAEMGHNWFVPKAEFERAVALSPVPNQAAFYVPTPETSTVDRIYDISHWNAITNADAFQAASVAIIHKATQGTAWVDGEYAKRRTLLADGDALWGAYHFGTNADGSAQADHFIDTVKPDGTFLLALDFENNPDKAEGNMTVAQAEAFINRIKERTGVYPVLYSRANLLPKNSPTFDLCPRWFASYHAAPPTMPAGWTTWALHQYSNGTDEPRLPGISGNIDRNQFNGTYTQLKTFWKSVSGKVVTSGTVWSVMYANYPAGTGINWRTLPNPTAPTINDGFANGTAVRVDKGSLTNGYVREQRGGWLANVYLSATPPVREHPDVRKWKIGFHVVQSDEQTQAMEEDLFIRLHEKGILSLLTIVNNIPLANRMAAIGVPYVVHRSVNDGKEGHERLDGDSRDIEKGKNCYKSDANHLNELDPRVIIQMYGCNEQNRPIYGQHDGWFYLGAMQAADAEGKGRKIVIFTDSVGNPDIVQRPDGTIISVAWTKRRESGCMRYAFEHGHYNGQHPYGAPECYPGSAIYEDGHRDNNQWFWYGDRWRAGYTLLADNEKPMVLGTEGGLFCAGYQNTAYLLNDLDGYQTRYGGDPLVGGLAYWTLGYKGGWEFSSFDRDVNAIYTHLVGRKP